uniref:UPF0481 protein At3g47200-like n=1 Tax=Elaeis guineensis var. tenera TaxID=51953 RepID=A0A6I9QMH8_ELAGV|nr:UPF0481 protein At3g47200-like [Elaeis guineensis]
MASLMNRARMEVNAANPMDGHSSICTIFKIPKHIRQLDDKAYDPVVASFGPFNNASPYSTSVTQDNKWQCVRHLLSRHGSSERANELLEICLKELVGLDKRVRSCYSGQIPLDAEALALIMLLDGCFIIYLMLKRKESLEKRKKENRTGEKTKEKVEDRGIGEGEVVLNIQEEEGLLDGPTMVGLSTFYLAVYDLLKLENQIPFFVIELLLDWLKTIEDGNIDLVDLALQLFKDIHPNESRSFVKKSPGEYHHLLHLFYLSRILSEMPAKSTSARGCMHIPHVYPKWKTTEAAPIRRAWASAPRWTPNATELDRAGVKFKRKEPVDSFLNITFEWRKKMEMTPVLGLLKSFLMFKSGRMEIPSLQIYDYTGPLFQNLIAFEQCYFRTEMYITIYTLFMDCIIDQAEDVRLLHLKGILEHKLSNDQAVAELFNQLGSQIHFYWETDYLKNHIAKVIEGVNEFYEFKWHKWLAGLRRDYLGNPWSIISVFAAVILLLLTIEQAVFAALSYVKS